MRPSGGTTLDAPRSSRVPDQLRGDPAPAPRRDPRAVLLEDDAWIHAAVRAYLGRGRDLPGVLLDDSLLVALGRLKDLGFTPEQAGDVSRSQGGRMARASVYSAWRKVQRLKAAGVAWAQ